MSFYVKREDNSFYDTKIIEDVLKDDNIPGKAIKTLIISLMKEHPDKESQAFDSEDKTIVYVGFTQDRDVKVSLGVEEKKRDWCFLLADDLDTQVQRTLKKRSVPFFSSRTFETMVFFIIGAFLMLLLSFAYTSKSLDITMESIQTMTIELKIQKILEILSKQEARVNWFLPSIMFTWVLIFALIEIRPISRIIEKLNCSVFYWGDMKTIYDNFINKVKRFKWGIVIALIISILAGLIVKFL